MTTFIGVYIPLDKTHPCAYLLDTDEEHMISVDDYFDNMKDEPITNKVWKKQFIDIQEAVKLQNLTDIIIARGW